MRNIEDAEKKKRIKTQDGSELGQAQLKLRFGFNFINLHYLYIMIIFVGAWVGHKFYS